MIKKNMVRKKLDKEGKISNRLINSDLVRIAINMFTVPINFHIPVLGMCLCAPHQSPSSITVQRANALKNCKETVRYVQGRHDQCHKLHEQRSSMLLQFFGNFS